MHRVNANGASIPAIGLGTWELSGETGHDIVRQALSIGYRHVDTAAMYGNEREVGEAIRSSGVARDEVFVTTKVWWDDLAPADLRRSAEQSLQRLGLDQVDLLLIHWPSPKLPLQPTIRALNRAKADGLSRHIGVSNFTTALLADAISLSSEPLVADQVEHHPFLDQTKLKRATREAGMALVSYCPLHRGRSLDAVGPIADAAVRLGRTPAQIVLRWHVQQEGVVAIPRTSNPARLAENIDVFDFALTENEMAAITALGARNHRLCDYDFAPRWDVA